MVIEDESLYVCTPIGWFKVKVSAVFYLKYVGTCFKMQMERVDKTVGPPINDTCGNGIREFPEECDRDDFGFYTCANVQARGYYY